MLGRVKDKSPLVHIIVGQVSANDCANVVLALGGRPITAECPLEVAQITANADVLAVSFTNITESRAEAIMISGHKALERGIKSVIDVVGVTCSDYRVRLAKRFIQECKPAVIKGNISEIRKLAQLAGISMDKCFNLNHECDEAGIINEKNIVNIGIDASVSDMKALESCDKRIKVGEMVRCCAAYYGAVVLATGVVDIISDGERIEYVEGGKPQMSRITGTGCMLNSIVATLLAVCGNEAGDNMSGKIDYVPLEAAVYASRIMKQCGEKADDTKGLGSYRVGLIDEISCIF